MTRIASFALHQMHLSQTLATQRRLVDLQMQIATGKVSRNYNGVALDARRLLNLENAMSGAQGFIKNINLIEGRLRLTENSIAGTFDVASKLRALLVNALNFENASALTLEQDTGNLLETVANALNVKHDNRYLFSGSLIDVPPIDIDMLLEFDLPLVDAAEFTGNATDSGTGITSLTGISNVQVESGTTGDAYQLEFDDTTDTFTLTNLNGGLSDQVTIGSVPSTGQTTDLEFEIDGDRIVVTIDENFDTATSITTATVTGNVAAGVGVFGTIAVRSTSGDISNIDRNDIEITGDADDATLTLSSTDGDFTATGVDLSVDGSQVDVMLENATTGAQIRVVIAITTGLDDTATADANTEIRLGDFLENVAASDGSENLTDARPGDPGYDPDDPAYYDGDSTILSARIDINAVTDYGATADESGFEKLIRALVLTRNANTSEGSIDRDTLNEALELAIEAIEEIPDIRSRVGSERVSLEDVLNRHEDFIVFTSETVSEIENVDITEAIARISVEQTQLEASFMLTIRLGDISLVNFLR